MRNKKLQGAMVAVICVGIILAGAFAWFSFTQQALNIFEGWTNPDVNLHDDFADPNKDVYVENSGKRPLFVRVKFDEYMEIDGNHIMSEESQTRAGIEDWITHAYIGTQGAELCAEDVHEYYDWIMGNAPSDPNKGYKYYLLAPLENRALFDELGMQLRNPTAVEFNDEQTYYGIPDPNSSTGGYIYVTLEDAYGYIETVLAEALTVTPTFVTPTFVTAQSGGTPVGSFTVTPVVTTNKDYLTWLYKVIDLNVSSVGHATNKTQAEADKISANTALDAFLKAAKIGYYQTSYDVISKAAATGIESDKYTFLELENEKDATGALTQIEHLLTKGYLENPTTEFVPLARTMTTAKIMTMAQWLAAGMPIGNYWVMDDDGWCYWADVLPPEQSTGLLLSEVVLDKLNPPNGVWWYGINVSLQAVTAEDIIKFGLESGTDPTQVGGGATEQGKMLLDAVSGKYVYGVHQASGTVGGTGTQLIPTTNIETYEKFKDNTYRLRVPDGTMNGTYGPLFIYTGQTGSTVSAMTSLFNQYFPAMTSNGATPPVWTRNYGTLTDNSAYKVGAKFWKLAEVNPETWVEFEVVDADQGSYESGVMQASNGKRYVKLSYKDKTGATQEAWLAIGANGVFDGLVQNTGNIVPAGTKSANNATGTVVKTTDMVSNNDDQLIWTDEDEPGIDDRYSEVPTAKSLKVGDTIMIDSIEWLVIGKNAGTDDAGADDTTLLISKDVLATVTYGTDGADVTTALATYADGLGNGKDKLKTLKEDMGDEVKAILLTPKEAIDYFASNATRAALLTGTGNNSAWWLGEDSGDVVPPATGSNVADNGGFEASEAVAETTCGLRPAIWVNSAKLYTHYQSLLPTTP